MVVVALMVAVQDTCLEREEEELRHLEFLHWEKLLLLVHTMKTPSIQSVVAFPQSGSLTPLLTRQLSRIPFHSDPGLFFSEQTINKH